MVRPLRESALSPFRFYLTNGMLAVMYWSTDDVTYKGQHLNTVNFSVYIVSFDTVY